MEKMGLKSFSTGPWIMDMDVNGCLPTEIEFNSPCLDRVILVQRYGTVSVAPISRTLWELTWKITENQHRSINHWGMSVDMFSFPDPEGI